MARITERFVKTTGKQADTSLASTRINLDRVGFTLQRPDGKMKRVELTHDEFRRLQRVAASSDFYDNQNAATQIRHRREVLAELYVDRLTAVQIAKSLCQRMRVKILIDHQNGETETITVQDLD